MKKAAVFVILLLMAGLGTLSVCAYEVGLDILEAEADIKNAASVSVDYKKGMLIGTDLLDVLSANALDAKDKYSGKDIEEYKDLTTDVQINLQGCKSDFTLELDKNIKEYAYIIDNVIINCNDICLYISTAEFQLNDLDENISINVEDVDGVVARYNGTFSATWIKYLLTGLFLVISLYLFALVGFIKKKQFGDNFNKRKVIGLCTGTAVVCLILASVAQLADFSNISGGKKEKLTDEGVHPFNVLMDGINSSDPVYGIQLGVPLYSEAMDTNLSAAVRRSADNLSGDYVVGGRYLDSMDIIKFPVDRSAGYYIRNNRISFDDVRDGDEELYEAVSVLASKNILNGKTDTLFGAEDYVTRGETVTMLCRMMNIPMETDSSEEFEDVERNSWYYIYAFAAREGGLLSGYEDNTFRGDNTITRQEFVSLLGQIMENRLGYIPTEEPELLEKFADRDSISAWAVGYAQLLEREGISIWEGEYLPDEPITRGDAAMLLYGVYNLYV